MTVAPLSGFHVAAIAACLAVLTPAMADAQGTAPVPGDRPFAFALGGGVMNGRERPLSATSSMGLLGTASVEYRTPFRPLRLRADGTVGGWSTSRMNALSAVTASAVLVPMPRWRVSPYVTAGGGAYFTRTETAAPGWTLGAGLRLPTVGRRTLLLETRAHAFENRGRVPGGGGSFPDDPQRYIWTPLSASVEF